MTHRHSTKNGFRSQNIGMLSNLTNDCKKLQFPKLKVKLKGLHLRDVAEKQEAVTDELEKAPKKGGGNFRQLFRKCGTAQKLVYVSVELILNKKGMCLRFKKNQS